MAVISTGAGKQTGFNNLPAIRFLPDGTIDENSPQIVQLGDVDGFGRRMVELPTRTGYEISNQAN
jgi:hypothetical protein